MGGKQIFGWNFIAILWSLVSRKGVISHGDHPLSKIAIHRAVLALDDGAYVKASPTVLGLMGVNSEWLTSNFSSPNPSIDDWIGVFSPANFRDLSYNNLSGPVPKFSARTFNIVDNPLICGSHSTEGCFGSSMPDPLSFALNSSPCSDSLLDTAEV